MQKDKHIIHMDQDAFFVSVEVRKNPQLIGKPVIIGGSSDRGVVASCSYEARKLCVNSARPARMAKQLCPHAFFLRGNMDEYSKASHEITDILKERDLENAYHKLELLGFPLSMSMFDLLKTAYRGRVRVSNLRKHIGKMVKMAGLYVCEKTVHTKNNKRCGLALFWMQTEISLIPLIFRTPRPLIRLEVTAIT